MSFIPLRGTARGSVRLRISPRGWREAGLRRIPIRRREGGGGFDPDPDPDSDPEGGGARGDARATARGPPARNGGARLPPSCFTAAPPPPASGVGVGIGIGIEPPLLRFRPSRSAELLRGVP